MNPYKLLILYHGVRESWRDDFENGIMKYWADRIKPVSGIDLALSMKDTGGQEQVQLKFFQYNSAGREAFGTANGKTISRQFVERNSYHQVMFMYDATKADLYSQMKGNKYLTSWAFWDELYNNTEYTEVKVENSPGFPKKTMSHELMHSLIKKCQRAGRSEVIDHMDKTVVDGKLVEYYKNNDPNAVDGNYSRTIKSITENNAWNTISLDTRNMYEARLVQGEKTIVLKKDGKWWEIATPPELYPYIRQKYQLPQEPSSITRAEVEANKGGQAKVDIYFGS